MRKSCRLSTRPIYNPARNLISLSRPVPITSLGITTFFFSFPFDHVLAFSFASDYQMVLDAQFVLTVQSGEPIVVVRELLHPTRHQITLPLNGVNFLFNRPIVAFNQTTEFTSDKQVTRGGVCVFQTIMAKLSMMCRLFFLDWDGWGFASAVEQNFNPSKENIKHREALGESTEKRKVRHRK